MRAHDNLWGYIYPWDTCIPRGACIPGHTCISRDTCIPRDTRTPRDICIPIDSHALSSQCITAHPSASHWMRLHQNPSDSHPLAKVGDRWKTMKVDLRRYRGQFRGGLREEIPIFWFPTPKSWVSKFWAFKIVPGAISDGRNDGDFSGDFLQLRSIRQDAI